MATRAFSIPCIEKAGLEADDIIACYVMAAKNAGWKVTIVSSDKDLMQLVEDGHVDMLDTMNDRRIDEAAVNEKFGVGPEKVGEVLALMGDSVDNVPGVPGVGPKTAACVLLFSCGKPAMPVDTHVHRVSQRLGLVPAKATAPMEENISNAVRSSSRAASRRRFRRSPSP